MPDIGVSVPSRSEMGALERVESVDAPTKATAHALYLQNGRVVVIPANRQLVKRRRITAFVSVSGKRRGNDCAGNDPVNPKRARLWLCFAP